uniref:Uncharacterized protein n=1 Tax=Anguilla anguilla TaxID=7936 RepID=A0A0E9WF31_ANGAN
MSNPWALALVLFQHGGISFPACFAQCARDRTVLLSTLCCTSLWIRDVCQMPVT